MSHNALFHVKQMALSFLALASLPLRSTVNAESQHYYDIGLTLALAIIGSKSIEHHVQRQGQDPHNDDIYFNLKQMALSALALSTVPLRSSLSAQSQHYYDMGLMLALVIIGTESVAHWLGPNKNQGSQANSAQASISSTKPANGSASTSVLGNGQSLFAQVSETINSIKEAAYDYAKYIS